MKDEYEYAKILACALWSTYHSDEAPDWEPLDDLLGVLTQIDNMLVGIIKRPMKHLNSKDCWCEPYLDYKDPETGNEVWVHREVE